MNKTSIGLLGLCLGAPLVFGAAPASAQQTSDEVVVTAERRATTVREVGFSIQAIGGEALRTAEVHDASAIPQLVPGITLNNSDKSITVVQIRGAVSTFRTATIDAPIGFFVDDVYYPYSTDLNLNFFDLNRLEVLRGPQGTLFGRNVTGGAFSIHTNDPSFDEDYLLSITAGNAGLVRTEGMVNGALIDGVLAGRVAFSTQRSNGQIDTPNLPGNWGGGSESSVRGKLLWTPNQDFRVLFSADYSDGSGDGSASQLTLATTSGAPPVVPATFNNAGGSFSTADWTSSDWNDSPNSVLQRGVSVNAALDIFGGTITSISSYRGTETASHLCNIIVPGVDCPLDYDNRVDNKWFTQEVRFASAPGRFSYQVGAFYLNGDYHTRTFIQHAPMAGSALAGFYAINPLIVDRDQHGTVNSIAVFGEGTFQFTDQLSLTLGGRWTKDDKDLDMQASSPTHDPTSSTQTVAANYQGPMHVFASHDWEAFTPRITLKWVPTDTINTYITYSEGFKSGGWVDQAYIPAAAVIPLQPEDATNWEVGFKSRLFDRTLDLNVAVFEQKTENLQNFSGSGGLPHSYNGDSRVRGLELEASWRATNALTLGLNYAYLDNEFTKLIDPLASPPANYAGNPLKYTPENSFTIKGEYDFFLANDAIVTLAADYAYNDSYSTQDSFSNSRYPDIYDNTEGNTVNSRITYTSGNGRFSVSGWVKNLTDNYQIIYADDVTAFVTTPVAGEAAWRTVSNVPRTFGVTFTMRH